MSLSDLLPATLRTRSPISRLNGEREAICREVVERVARRVAFESATRLEYTVEALLSEAAHVELARMEERGLPADKQLYWRKLAQTVSRARDEDSLEELRRVSEKYATDAIGHFSQAAYWLATGLVPAGIALALSSEARWSMLGGGGSLSGLADRVRIEGNIEHLRRLAQRGTLVFVPTHSSHMDNLLIGWAIHHAGLPAVAYGAEVSLFDNPLTAAFMRNLGAYRVDRRLEHKLYKVVLTELSQCLIERGYPGLFFAAGKRSRTNQIEQQLKLGLLGSVVGAYVRNVTTGMVRPEVFVVPVVINYTHVLEANTLIEDHLRHRGKGRSIIEQDEFHQPARVARFIQDALDKEAPISLRFCNPTDVFGNELDELGRSVGPAGQVLDTRRYLWVGGKPAIDRDRDRQYTRELGGRLVETFMRNNTVSPLHIVSFALYEHLRRKHGSWDFYALFRFARGLRISTSVLSGEVERLARLLRREADAGRIRLSPEAAALDPVTLLRAAADGWATYHKPAVAELIEGYVQVSEPQLVYFYGNRLRGYGLENELAEGTGGYGHG